jgi:hypothetical protein
MVAYSFKRRFVDQIRAGLGLIGLPVHPKRQTIRAIRKRRHAQPGDVLQLYCGLRTKSCFQIGIARCTHLLPISIFVDSFTLQFTLDGVPVIADEYDAFVRADGFANLADMYSFWRGEHGIGRFDGVLIKWEPIS